MTIIAVMRYVLTDEQWARMSPLCLVKVGVMLPLFFGVLSSLLTRPFCAVPRTSVARIAWD